MELDFEKSLTYISKDPGWVNKLLAGSGILLASFAVFLTPLIAYLFTDSKGICIGSLLLCIIFAIILTLLLTGYCVQTGNKIINYSNTFLPDWNEFKKMLKTGLKYFVGTFIYSLPALLLSLIFLICLFFALGGNAFHPAVFILLTMLGAATLVVYILLSIFYPLMSANFYKDLKILSFVNFKTAFEMLKGNVGNYCVLILLFLALSVLAQIIMSLLSITIIGLIFVPVLTFYTYLVSTNLIAQFVLCAKEKEINTDAVNNENV